MHWTSASRKRTERAKRELTLTLHRSKVKKKRMDYFVARQTKKFPGCINARLRMPRKGSHIFLGTMTSEADFSRAHDIIDWLDERKIYMLVHEREDHAINRLTQQFLGGKITFPEWTRASEAGIGPVTLGFRTQKEMFEFKMRWY